MPLTASELVNEIESIDLNTFFRETLFIYVRYDDGSEDEYAIGNVSYDDASVILSASEQTYEAISYDEIRKEIASFLDDGLISGDFPVTFVTNDGYEYDIPETNIEYDGRGLPSITVYDDSGHGRGTEPVSGEPFNYADEDMSVLISDVNDILGSFEHIPFYLRCYGDEITPRKEKKARRAFGIPDDDAIALISCGMFVPVIPDGFAICHSGVYFKSALGDTGHYPWGSHPKIDAMRTGLIYLDEHPIPTGDRSDIDVCHDLMKTLLDRCNY